MSLQKKKIADFVIENPNLVSFSFQSKHFFNLSSCTKRPSETFLMEIFKITDFLRLDEFLLLKNANNPYLLKVEDVRATANNVYIIYEPFLDDRECELLSSFLQKGAKFSIDQALSIALNIISAVFELHKHCLIHRGISPKSIFRQKNKWKLGGYDYLKYVKDLHSDVKFSFSFRPNDENEDLYLAPEILEQTYGYNCDAFSIGVLLLEMIVGPGKAKKNKGKFLLENLGLPKEIIDILVPILNEGHKNRTDMKKLKRQISGLLNKTKEEVVKSIEISNKGSVKPKTSEGIFQIQNQLQMNIKTFQYEGIHSHYLDFLILFADLIQIQTNDIPKQVEEIKIQHKNAVIYQLVYLLMRLELVLRKKIASLTQNETEKKDLHALKNDVHKINDLLKDKTKFFKKTVALLADQTSEEFSHDQLVSISDILKEFIEIIYMEKAKKPKKRFLLFLESLGWIRKKLKEELFGTKEIKKEKLKKYKKELDKIKERNKKKNDFNEAQLRDDIEKYLDN